MAGFELMVLACWEEVNNIDIHRPSYIGICHIATLINLNEEAEIKSIQVVLSTGF